MFRKIKNQKIKETASDSDKEITVHTMPKKLLKTRPATKSGDHLNIIVFIVIFAVIGGASAYFFRGYLFPSKAKPVAVNNINIINNNINKNIHKNTDGSANNNVNKNKNVNKINKNAGGLNRNYNRNVNFNINDVIRINSNDNANINSNANENKNSNTSAITIIPPAPDKDSDTLTDIEEILYGTKSNVSDTDGDGFLDGQELANLYDPLSKDSKKIKDSGLIKVYVNPTYKYSIFYPASWHKVSLGGGDQEVTFVSATKEFIEVTVMDNPKGLTASEWYLEQIPKDLAYKAELVWANKFRGIKSLDGMYVYLTPISGENNFIYSISYMVGSQTSISYPVTFQMMVRSFDLQ